MRIPTILSDASVNTGPTSPYATPDQFGADMAQSIGQLSGAISRTASAAVDINQMIDRRKAVGDVTWASERLTEEQAFLSEWMANPENNSKETYAEDLQALMQERKAKVLGGAGNARSAAIFQRNYNELMRSRTDSAIHTVVKNQELRTVTSITTQVSDLLEGFRHARDVPNYAAADELESGMRMIGQNIDSAFGGVAPETAQKLRDHLTTQVAYGIMDADPELAKRVVNQNKNLDEHVRRTLLDRIDDAGQSRNAAELVAFNQVREDHLTRVEHGVERGKIDLVLYQAHLPRDRAQAQKMMDDAVIDTYNAANDKVRSMEGWDPLLQRRELNRLGSNIKSKQDEMVVQMLERKITAQEQLVARNPVSWLQQYNPVVRSALDRASKSTEATRVGSLAELYDLMLKYQGTAPEGDPNPKLYLGLPTNSRHLLTIESAEEGADRINQGAPSQKLDLIREVLNSYPGKNYQNIAFNDLVTLPKQGIRQEYQLAFLNPNATWVKSYLGAIENSESIKKLTPEKLADFEAALEGNSSWLQFRRAMIGDNFQRGDEVAGFQNGILSYAYARSAQFGESPKGAIKVAATQLLESELGFASVNDQSLALSRDRGLGKPYRSDQDIAMLGERLNLSLQFIDPREIKLTDRDDRPIFGGLSAAGTDMTRLQALRDQITMHGVFMSGPDGESVSLYYADGRNQPFEIRDKDNRAFVINLEDLQNTSIFNTRQVSLSGFRIPTTPGVQGIGTGLKPRTYDIVESHKNFGLGAGTTYSTNWPMSVNFIRREPR